MIIIKRQILSSLLMSLCLMIVLGGCSFTGSTPKVADKTGYSVQDYQGSQLQLSSKPQRIVSLTLGTDEILLSLVAPSRLAGLTYLADDPGVSNVVESAKEVPGRVKGNLESVIGLKPDLVIVANWQPIELIKSIKDAGIPVYVYKAPTTISEIKTVIMDLGNLVGEKAKGTEIVTKMDEELASLGDKIKKNPSPKKPVVIHYTLTGATYGKGSLFDDICTYANVENGVAKAGGSAFESLPKEKIIEVNPDILILPGWDAAGKKDVTAFKAEVQQDPAFQSVSAIKNNKLVIISDKYVSSASQYITLGVKEIVQFAYPE